MTDREVGSTEIICDAGSRGGEESRLEHSERREDEAVVETVRRMVGVESYCQKDGLFGRVSVPKASCQYVNDWFCSNHATFFYAQLAGVKLVANG